MRLIDADALLKRFDEEHEKITDVDDYYYLVKDASTVEANPAKHGMWVFKETMVRSPFAKNAYCSECLEDTILCYNYCPNCGARMDLEVQK